MAQITPKAKLRYLYECLPKNFEILGSSEKEVIEAGTWCGEGYLCYDAIHSECDKNTLRWHDSNLLIAVDALELFIIIS